MKLRARITSVESSFPGRDQAPREGDVGHFVTIVGFYIESPGVDASSADFERLPYSALRRIVADPTAYGVCAALTEDGRKLTLISTEIEVVGIKAECGKSAESQGKT